MTTQPMTEWTPADPAGAVPAKATDSNRPLNIRAFVALVAALAGVGLPVSGFANHLLQMEPMTQRRHAWMSAHNGLGLLFAAFAIWHVVLNRGAFLRYLHGLTARSHRSRQEIAWAVAVVAAVLVVTVGHTLHAR
jgi:uncharacterized membrane protein YidH (DUF202 family)